MKKERERRKEEKDEKERTRCWQEKFLERQYCRSGCADGRRWDGTVHARHSPGKSSHLAVAVADLEASHQRHEEMGLNPKPLKGLPGQGARFYFLSDPDGYLVEVVRE